MTLFTAPRLAWYKQQTWKRHQDTVYWVDFQLAQRKGLKFYQTRSNAIIFYDTLPAYCISKVIVMKSEDESVDIDTEPSYSCDAELDDELIGKALPSPPFIQERQEPANRRQAYHSHKESLLPAQFFLFRTHKYGETHMRTWFVPGKESGFSLKDTKSKFSLKSEPRSRSTNFKPILIEEVSRN